MAEGWMNLFVQDDYAGTKRPHYKLIFELDNVKHECAFWPAPEGKKGYRGKFKMIHYFRAILIITAIIYTIIIGYYWRQ